MRRSTALSLIVGATLAVAASANAATVEVKYLLSSIEVFGAGSPIGPPGQGTLTVSYSSTETAPGTILPDPPRC